MASISDEIEQFILSVMSDDESVKLSRNDLAHYFSVAPSQINYVLATRFNFDKGYIIESKRGGGGCITLVRISDNKEDILPELVQELDNIDVLTFNRASNFTDRLVRDEVITKEEGGIIKSALSDKALNFPAHVGKMRKNIFKEIVIGLMRR